MFAALLNLKTGEVAPPPSPLLFEFFASLVADQLPKCPLFSGAWEDVPLGVSTQFCPRGQN